MAGIAVSGIQTLRVSIRFIANMTPLTYFIIKQVLGNNMLFFDLTT